MVKQSAGILFYRFHTNKLQVLLLHPGGPYWVKKDAGAWTIPKGELLDSEAPLVAALREAAEETSIHAEGYFIELQPIKQKSGKIVHAFASQFDIDPALLTSNTFEIEWPPRSGMKKVYPEIDKAAWFNLEEAHSIIQEGQRPLLIELNEMFGLQVNNDNGIQLR